MLSNVKMLLETKEVQTFSLAVKPSEANCQLNSNKRFSVPPQKTHGRNKMRAKC